MSSTRPSGAHVINFYIHMNSLHTNGNQIRKLPTQKQMNLPTRNEGRIKFQTLGKRTFVSK